MISNFLTGSSGPVSSPEYRKTLSAKINGLKSREKMDVELQTLSFVSNNRREAFAWFRQRNCYVKYVHKRRVIELCKM